MSGYVYTVSSVLSSDPAGKSPIASLESYAQDARNTLARRIKNAKTKSFKLDAPCEHTKKEPGAARQTLVLACMTNSDGVKLTLRMERFLVGGGAAKRGLKARGQAVIEPSDDLVIAPAGE